MKLNGEGEMVGAPSLYLCLFNYSSPSLSLAISGDRPVR